MVKLFWNLLSNLWSQRILKPQRNSYLITIYLSLTASFAQGQTSKITPSAPTSGHDDQLQALYRPLEIEYHLEEERQSCEPIDLRAEFEARGLPDVRHQDSTGWCYAYVGADLVSYELKKNISAADIARQYLNRGNTEHITNGSGMNSSFPLGGGFTDQAITLTNEGGGFCLEEEFPSEDYSISLAHAPVIQYPANSGAAKQQTQLICLETEILAEMYNQIPIRNLLETIVSNEMRSILNVLARSRCTQRFTLPSDIKINSVSRMIGHPYDSPENLPLYQKIDDVLSDNRPVSVTIDSSSFSSIPKDRIRLAPSPEHQAVIAGRRFNQENGRCEYLIRNSESGCQSYNQEYECENNHFWMPRKLVRMASGSADYFTASASGQ